MRRKNFRIALDLIMTILLPMLMAYSLIGEKFHEIIGSAMLLLFVTHHILNRKWYGSICKGKQTFIRIFRSLLNLVLLILMILQPVSGILMSRYLYTFIRIKGVSAYAREIHLMIGYWCYILCCIHAGIHLVSFMSRLNTQKKVLISGIWILISVYGIYAFFKRQFPDYMFRKTLFAFFDFSEPRVLFFLDYLSIMALFVLIGYMISGMPKISKKNSSI